MLLVVVLGSIFVCSTFVGYMMASYPSRRARERQEKREQEEADQRHIDYWAKVEEIRQASEVLIATEAM
jgi:hypothetical protein